MIQEKFLDGMRSPWAILYLGIPAIGVAWASVGIPILNRNDISPETLGIYVIGFLISVLVDAMFVVIKRTDESRDEGMIAALILLVVLALGIAASYLSIRSFDLKASPTAEGRWAPYATPLLVMIFIATIMMSLVLAGIDPKLPPNPSLDKRFSELRNR